MTYYRNHPEHFDFVSASTLPGQTFTFDCATIPANILDFLEQGRSPIPTA